MLGKTPALEHFFLCKPSNKQDETEFNFNPGPERSSGKQGGSH